MVNKIKMGKNVFNIAFCVISLYVFVFVAEMDWIWTIGICIMPITEIIISIRNILCNMNKKKHLD